jgi:hypothetical protein
MLWWWEWRPMGPLFFIQNYFCLCVLSVPGHPPLDSHLSGEVTGD